MISVTMLGPKLFYASFLIEVDKRAAHEAKDEGKNGFFFFFLLDKSANPYNLGTMCQNLRKNHIIFFFYQNEYLKKKEKEISLLIKQYAK